MKKVSMIVPIYNTRRELPRCLTSICRQTYGNLEIICVDDGSTDGSEKILDEFAAEDPRILAIHKPNGGESSARNVGLRHATGEYIGFCDCDDWIDADMVETLAAAMEKDDLDMAAGSWYREFTHPAPRTVAVTNEQPVTAGMIDNSQLLQYLYMRDSYRGFAYIWDKLYRREILCDEMGELIPFDESLALGGDIIYLAEAALNVKRARYIDRAFYHYLQRWPSGSHTDDFNTLCGTIKAYEYIIDRFEARKVKKEIIDYVKRQLAWHCSNDAVIAYNKGNAEELRFFQFYMKKYEQEYVSLNAGHPEWVERYGEILRRSFA